MVPVGPAFNQLSRVVRDTAAQLDKEVNFVLEGEEVEIDTAMLELLRDPLAHLVRNAVDHGIDPVSERLERGKPAAGTITLRSHRQGDQVIVEVIDDGRGLDRKRIVESAIERGLIASADHLSDAAVWALIFTPGFSTSAQVTNISGRGVGMDVVHRNVEALRGSIEIVAEAGRGTSMRLILPLSIAAIEGFGVDVAGQTFILPANAVTECVDAPADCARRGAGVLQLRGQPVPYIGLREAFAIGGAIPERQSVVVVSHGGRRAAFAVDEILGVQQAVIKPLDPLLRPVRGFSASTILADGRVALIVDIPALVTQLERGNPCSAG